MKIKSTKAFRTWFKTYQKGHALNDSRYNENFIGTYHGEGPDKIKGFFEMYHGEKTDIAAHLPSILKIAEDGQAIYEFLQNAVDCDSTHFYIFYNEKYFLAINNGSPFDSAGFISILNIAQTTKKDCEKIGRFGIGFKLAHRLVGKNEGTKELAHDYKGPILFSWAKKEDLEYFMQKQTLEPFAPISGDIYDKKFVELPLLAKILLTNFPAMPGEVVKDLNYDDSVLFENEELDEFISYLQECMANNQGAININDLQQGTMFFIRLGEGKKAKLDEDYEDLVVGTQYSMNILRSLEKIFLNDTFIQKERLVTERFEIAKNTPEFAAISPEYQDCNIKVMLGFHADYHDGIGIQKAPNFYKYFPMGDEINGFNFIIHCDSFSNESNRRKLQKDDVNKNLFPVIADHIIELMERYKNTNPDYFLNLYAAVLLSKIPDKQDNQWLNPILYQKLLTYIKNNIPTKHGNYQTCDKAAIDGTGLELDLVDFGIESIEWFKWCDADADRELIGAAKDKNKIQLPSWKLDDILKKCDISKTNAYLIHVYDSNREQYNRVVDAVHKIAKSTWNNSKDSLFNVFKELYFFSYIDEQKQEHLVSLNFCLANNILILQTKHKEICPILEKIGLSVSQQFIDSEEADIDKILSEKINYIEDETKLYNIIVQRLAQNTSVLSPTEKHTLFSCLKDFKNVGEKKLQQLALFTNAANVVTPLGLLIDGALSSLPSWLATYQINEKEYKSVLSEYLVKGKEIYCKIIVPYWADIIMHITNAEAFYASVLRYYELDEAKNKVGLTNEDFIFVNKNTGFKSAKEIFYNANLSDIDAYQDLSNGINLLTTQYLPHRTILDYLEKPPFYLPGQQFSKLEFDENVALSLGSTKAILEFCKRSDTGFFQKYAIKKSSDGEYIFSEDENIFQYKSPNEDTYNFINRYLSDIFWVLPRELKSFDTMQGILKNSDVYRALLDNIDIDEHKSELIDVMARAGAEAQKFFLEELPEIQFSPVVDYTVDDFEYRVLKMAIQTFDKEEFAPFRSKLVVETEQGTINMHNIPSQSGEIEMEGEIFSLARLLPQEFANADYLLAIVNNMVKLGLDKAKLNSLLGVDNTMEENEIWSLLSEKEILENADQLKFAILYAQLYGADQLGEIKVLATNNAYELKDYNFYTAPYSFLVADAALHEQYAGIDSMFKNFPVCINDDEGLELLKEPYFQDNKFVCPDIDTAMSDEQRIDLLEFIYKKWLKDKTPIQGVDWSKFGDTDTNKILDFQPTACVYPTEYALDDEQLPVYVLSWIANDAKKESFIMDLGVAGLSSAIVKLRQYFLNENGVEFDGTEFDKMPPKHLSLLENTLDWLVANDWQLDKRNEYAIFEKMVKHINSFYIKKHKLNILCNYDIEELDNESEEWEDAAYQQWKLDNDDAFCIMLYKKNMPHLVRVEEYGDYVFCTFDESPGMIQDEYIYVNKNFDVKRVLAQLAGNSGFEFEDLVKLYTADTTPQDTKLKDENERLRAIIKELQTPKARAKSNPTTSFDNDYLQDICEQSETFLYEYLKNEYPGYSVEWLNSSDEESFLESFNNHDFELYHQDKLVCVIDCKGTPANKRTFYLTKNEWEYFLDCVEQKIQYLVYRVFNVGQKPTVRRIDLWKEIQAGIVVPYLQAEETIAAGRIFLTILE